MSKTSSQVIIPAVAAVAVATLYLCKPSSALSSSSTNTSSANKNSYLLIGDIGGTNTRLALYQPTSAEALYAKEYQNSQYITTTKDTFEKNIFLPFLNECNDQGKVPLLLDTKNNASNSNATIVACFAVAGPVKNNRCILTNLGGGDGEDDPTTLDGSSIEGNNDGLLRCIKRCKVINDFVGQGYGLLDLDLDKEVVELVPGSRAMIDPHGPKACLGAGTGLGECYLTTSSLHPEEGYECYGSEGGHVDYVPRSDLQVKLLNYLKDKFQQPNRVSVERVVSGKGLANVYEFLSKTFPEKTKQHIQDEFEVAGDMQGRVVGVHANDKNDPCELCVEAMEIMISAYGAEAGNCAVKFIPTGGLYVSGGLTPKNIDFIAGEDSPFMRSYYDKGRMSPLVKSIPLFAVLVEDLGMRGARVCALREYQSMTRIR